MIEIRIDFRGALELLERNVLPNNPELLGKFGDPVKRGERERERKMKKKWLEKKGTMPGPSARELRNPYSGCAQLHKYALDGRYSFRDVESKVTKISRFFVKITNQGIKTRRGKMAFGLAEKSNG